MKIKNQKKEENMILFQSEQSGHNKTATNFYQRSFWRICVKEETIESWKIIGFPNQAYLKFGQSWYPLELWETVNLFANFKMSIYKRNLASN